MAHSKGPIPSTVISPFARMQPCASIPVISGLPANVLDTYFLSQEVVRHQRGFENDIGVLWTDHVGEETGEIVKL